MKTVIWIVALVVLQAVFAAAAKKAKANQAKASQARPSGATKVPTPTPPRGGKPVVLARGGGRSDPAQARSVRAAGGSTRVQFPTPRGTGKPAAVGSARTPRGEAAPATRSGRQGRRPAGGMSAVEASIRRVQEAEARVKGLAEVEITPLPPTVHRQPAAGSKLKLHGIARDPAAMRRAVLLAEILGTPRGLRF